MNIGKAEFTLHQDVIQALNELQDDFKYYLPPKQLISWGSPFIRSEYTTDYLFDLMEKYRQDAKGFHPFIIGLVHSPLQAKELGNLFGSSVEGLQIAKTIQLGLEHVTECTIWHQGVFGLSLGNLENLVNSVSNFDYAVLVLTPDDVKIKRDLATNTPRDNVLFELGLFMGALGRENTFLVHNRDEEIELPSDLAGVIAATFGKRQDNNLEAALGSVCTRLENSMKIN